MEPSINTNYRTTMHKTTKEESKHDASSVENLQIEVVIVTNISSFPLSKIKSMLAKVQDQQRETRTS